MKLFAPMKNWIGRSRYRQGHDSNRVAMTGTMAVAMVVMSLLFAPWLPDLVPTALAQDEMATSAAETSTETESAEPTETADAAETAPENQEEKVGGGEVMDVTITGLRGIVQVREGDDAPWQRAEAGMVVGIGAEFRTGPRSVVQFRLGRDHEVTLDRLGVIKVLDAVVADGKVKTDVGLKYGRTQYKVAESGVEHDSVIRSPASTLVVRGSDVVIQDQGFVSQVAFLERSPATLTTSDGKTVAAGNGVISGSATSAAATASALTVFSALGSATTGNELERLAQLGGSSLGTGTTTSGAGGAGFAGGSGGFNGSEPVVGGPGVPIQPGQEYTFTAPTGVAFYTVFLWQGSTDIDTAVFTPSGNGFSPYPSSFSGNVARSGDGVFVSGDDTGSTGQTNQEYVAFVSTPEPGKYRAQAHLFSGPATEVQIRAFRAGDGGATELSGSVRGLVQGGSIDLVTEFVIE